MKATALILGPSGRMGRNAASAFEADGWEVRRFDRATDDLWDAAWGADVIVNAWNPPYPKWESELPGLTDKVIEVARASGALVIVPGNVYVYGADAPELFAPETPHRATNRLGRARINMETRYRAAGVRTLIVRAGDYIDSEASGNWFDGMMVKNLGKARLTYPGRLDAFHAFAYLPDVAAVMVGLANRRDALELFEDVTLPGYTLTGVGLASSLSEATGTRITARRMSWLPLWLAAPFWPMGRGLLEMRYLWSKPHRLDGARLDELLPDFSPTPVTVALRSAIAHLDIDPDQPVTADGHPILAK